MTRTAELTAKLLDHALSDVERAELDALVGSDPSAEAEHLALLELEAELRALRTGFDLAAPTLAMIQAAQSDRTATAVLAQISASPPPPWEVPPQARARRRARAWLAGTALVACAAALVLGVWLGQKPSASPESNPAAPELAFAKLSRMSGAVEVFNAAGDAIPAAEGAELPAGFMLHTKGDDSLAVVELLRDRALFEIESDSVVRFVSNPAEPTATPRLFLAAGQLTAAVSVRATEAFVVGTPVADVSTLGGTFVLSSAGPESARVDIKQGKVELRRAATPKPFQLIAGSAVVRAGSEKVDLERTPVADRIPRRTLAAPNTRDAVFSPDGAEVWVATARSFARWRADGSLQETSFYPRKGGNDGVAAFTRDKRYLFTFRGDREDRVLVRTVPDGGEHASIGARMADPRLWTIAPDGDWLAITDNRPNNKQVRVYDGRVGEERFTREIDEQVTCLAAAPDGSRLAVAVHALARGANNKVILVNPHTNERLFALSALRRPATAMAFSADGHRLAVGFNGVVQLWDLRHQELIRSISGFERALTCIAFSPDGTRLAAGTQDGHVWIWDAETGRQTQLIAAGGRMVRSIGFRPDGKQLVTVANAAPVSVWDVTDALLRKDLQ